MRPRTIKEAMQDGNLYRVIFRDDRGHFCGEFTAPWAETPEEIISGPLKRLGPPPTPQLAEVERIISGGIGAYLAETVCTLTYLPRRRF